MTRRRALSGKPLLVAAGLGLSMACNSHEPVPPPPIGNLMPPPTVHTELCVDAFPPGATVVVDQTPLPGRCIDLDRMEGMSVTVDVSAPGLPPHSAQVTLTPPKQTITVTLAPAPPPDLTIPPIGNLMPPPRPPEPMPRPVGNLMPPPMPQPAPPK
jgi:hypothetical protein